MLTTGCWKALEKQQTKLLLRTKGGAWARRFYSSTRDHSARIVRRHTKVFRTLFEVFQIHFATIATKTDPSFFFPLVLTVSAAILMFPCFFNENPEKLYVIDKVRAPSVIHT